MLGGGSVCYDTDNTTVPTEIHAQLWLEALSVTTNDFSQDLSMQDQATPPVADKNHEIGCYYV